MDSSEEEDKEEVEVVSGADDADAADDALVCNLRLRIRGEDRAGLVAVLVPTRAVDKEDTASIGIRGIRGGRDLKRGGMIVDTIGVDVVVVVADTAAAADSLLVAVVVVLILPAGALPTLAWPALRISGSPRFAENGRSNAQERSLIKELKTLCFFSRLEKRKRRELVRGGEKNLEMRRHHTSRSTKGRKNETDVCSLAAGDSPLAFARRCIDRTCTMSAAKLRRECP